MGARAGRIRPADSPHQDSRNPTVTQAEEIQTIQPLFRDVLDQPDLLLTPASNASNVDDWDSLAHINIVMAIERHYKVKFALGELQGLKNVGEMADLIIRKTGKS